MQNKRLHYTASIKIVIRLLWMIVTRKVTFVVLKRGKYLGFESDRYEFVYIADIERRINGLQNKDR